MVRLAERVVTWLVMMGHVMGPSAESSYLIGYAALTRDPPNHPQFNSIQLVQFKLSDSLINSILTGHNSIG